MLFRQIVLYALLIGAATGLLLTAVQFWQVFPIIQSAEHFEDELASLHAHSGHGHEHGAHDHDHEHGDGVQRTGLTLLSNMMIGAGFAMLMLSVMVASRRNQAAAGFHWRHGLIWGAAGYAVFFLAPALGQPPEIPGAAGASLEARQLWWLFTVVCTAAGLAGVAFLRSPWRWAALGLVAVPHLVGAPEAPTAMFAEYPPAMAAELEVLTRQFFSATAIANAIQWLVLGLASAWAVRRMLKKSEANL
jgi:cobalt transporter subunit CbtA